MKIVLLQPPIRDFYETDIRLQPLGLCYLKATIQKHFSSVRVIVKDYHAGWGRRTLPWPRELTYLKPYYGKADKSPFCTFHHFYHFGADYETIARDLKKESPDLIGISSLFTAYYQEVLETASAIKREIQVPIFAGGSHASALPETLLAHPAIDFVIRGEGERAIVKFLKQWQRKADSLSSKKKLVPSPTRNFPVDKIPFPDFSDLSRSHYLYEGKPLCFILTSRGCPYHCSFCSVHETFGHQYRRRSNDNILREIQLRYEQGYRVFDLEDDNLTFDKKAACLLFKKIILLFPKNDLQFLAMNGICYWHLDHELLSLMRQAGFTHLNLSLVSSNPSVCQTARRPLDLKKYRSVIEDAFRLGFKIVSYQILGLPGETEHSMARTLILHAKLPVLIGASPFYVAPGKANEPPPSTVNTRLTGLLAWRTPKQRDSVYTFFVITRILNFLKGISLQGDSSLKTALRVARKSERRSVAGVKILEMLLEGRGLHGWSHDSFELQPRFRSEHFYKVWRKIDRIATQEGRSIILKGKL